MREVKEDGFFVSPRSAKEIATFAEKIRNLFYPYREKYVDVIDLVERKLSAAYENFTLDIVDDYELPDREAEMCPAEFCIRIRESVYVKAHKLDCHSRFTIAHEVGHFFLHRHQALAFGKPSTNGRIPAYNHSEWQANTFARSFLAPDSLAKGMASEQIEVLFGVSRRVAEIVSGHHTIIPRGIKPCLDRQTVLPGFERFIF